jgi:FKBP-type peptidyl-prolyl cis-trans isomerase 2
MAVKKGSKVKIHYTGTLDDGTVFDSSENHGKPLEFEVGAGMVIPGFEKGILGMKKGEEKNIKIKPEDAYGNPNPGLVKKIPRQHLPPEPEPKKGMMLALRTPDGRQIPAIIAEVTDEDVTIDLNHPLAGKTLNFKIKVVEVS